MKIDLADRSYDIRIGRHLLEKAGTYLAEILKPSQVIIITHPTIRKLHGQALAQSLSQAGYPTQFLEVPEGESSKSLEQVGHLYDRLLELKCDRHTVLVALGGGVIGDLAGFVAATYLRGIPYIQVPTTLLSQVDSSVGGKTGVNHPSGKNLIGAFYQPRMVIVDLATLGTLPEREFKAGLAEIIKHGVILDSALFDYLENHVSQILSLDPDSLRHIIGTSCAIKAKVVEKDERESRYRMLLNFGHTIGHALESLTGYTQLIHGEAVAIGMVCAAKLSMQMGKCGKEVPDRITTLVEKFGLPAKLPDLPTEDIIQAMYLDKKTLHNKLTFILTQEIGKVEIEDDVPEKAIRLVL